MTDAAIAVVGMGCRFPGGVSDEDSLWELMTGRVDAIGEPPPGRPELGSAVGGFLDEVERFDARYFEISAREAVRMDPQQRTFLEVACEAIENGGLPIRDLAGTRTGVFAGISLGDYAQRFTLDHPDLLDAHFLTGNAFSAAAGRVAHVLGLEGPAMALDTACSSSLVAVHHAARSLRLGECDLAIAGGVNLILSPVVTAAATRGRMLSPDGRCKAFDAAADGYARSEGCGVVVLKRAGDARRDGDRVRALVRGSATNHNGGAAGLTVPSRRLQERLLRDALADAGVAASEVGYVEAHGTGTSLGDPIELGALDAVLGRAGGEEPCRVGALKTNIGHTESAAGVAGLIKAVLVLEHGLVPPNIHFGELNPRVSLDGSRLAIADAPLEWPAGERPRIAGVSSFGISGVNAHVVIEEAPADARAAVAAAGERPAGPYLLPLSARDADALPALVGSYAAALESRSGDAVADVVHTAAVRRSHYEHRGAVAGGDRAELVAGLRALAAGADHPGVTTGVSLDALEHRVVFVFSGQGSQWPGMGRALLRAGHPAFVEALARCDGAIAAVAGWSLLEELAAPPEASRLGEVDVVQPAIFAVQVALAALWRSWGVEPDAVVGHSMGEVAAAHVAGALGVEDAARVVCARSRLVRSLSGAGGMAFVELPGGEARAAIAPFGERLSVAAENGPRSTLVSGEPAPLEELLAELGGSGVFCRRVDVDYASHCAQVEPLLDPLREALRDVAPREPEVPFHSSVGGDRAPGSLLDAGYWAENLRRPVRFWPRVAELMEAEHDVFLELSPHPLLLGAIGEAAEHAGQPVSVLGSLRRDEDERASLLASLGALYTLGTEIDWGAVGPEGRPVALPAYPWQGTRLAVPWEEPGRSRRGRGGSVLGAAVRPAAGEVGVLWEGDLHPELHPELYAHSIAGRPVLALSAWAAIAAAAAEDADPAYEVAGLTVERPLELSGDGAGAALQVTLGRSAEDAGRELRVYAASGSEWVLHARAHARAREEPDAEEAREPDGGGEASPSGPGVPGDALPSPTGPGVPGDAVPSPSDPGIPGDDFYGAAAARGVEYAAALRPLERLWVGGGAGLARLRPGGERSPGTADRVAIEAGLQLALATLGTEGYGAGLPVPVSIASVRRIARGEAAWARARMREAGEGGAGELDAVLLDASGSALIELRGIAVADMGAVGAVGSDEPGDWLYEVAWRPAAEAGAPAPAAEASAPAPAAAPADAAAPANGTASPESGDWLVVADAGGVAETLAGRIRADGGRCTLVGAEDAGAALAAAARDGAAPQERAAPLNVVFAAALDAPASEALSPGELERSLRTVCGGAVALEQAMAEHGAERSPPRLWIVTRDALAAGAGDRVEGVAAASLSGLARAIATEHPELWGGLVDLDRECSADDAARLTVERIAAGGGEHQVAIRAGTTLVPRLRPKPAGAGAPHTPAPSPDATYLIAGGLGPLGLALARRLAEQGVRRLALIGRSGARPEQAAELDAIRELGAEVRAGAVDVADEAALLAFAAELSADGWPPVGGVFHAAAVIDDSLLARMPAERLEAVLRPKALGAWALHRVFRDADPFVLFSSAAALLGLPGQGSYAAANSFLGGLARHRRAQGLAALAVHWSTWSGLGLAVTPGAQRMNEHLERSGIRSLPPEGALRALDALMERGDAEAAVLRVSGDAGTAPVLASSPLLSELAGAPARPRDSALRDRLALAGSHGERAALIEDHLEAVLAAVLHVDRAQLDPRQPVQAHGVDSLLAMELRTTLQTDLGLPLSATVFWTYPTPRELAGHLAGLLAPADAAGADAPDEEEHDDDIAAVLAAAIEEG